MSYDRRCRKKPVVERRTHLAKAKVVFGIVVRPDGCLLIIQDNLLSGCRRRWEDSDSKYKTSGGRVPAGMKPEDFIKTKIREEASVFTVHLNEKEPFFVIKVGGHLEISFYLMGYVRGEPKPDGKKIKFADFLSLEEVRGKMGRGEFLENHRRALQKYLEGHFSDTHRDALKKYFEMPTS